MLSKWNYCFYKEYKSASITFEKIEAVLSECGIHILSVIPGGTLSRVYEISGNRVLKTQIHGNKNLYKEYCILEKLYHNLFSVYYNEILIDNEKVAYYIMPKMNSIGKRDCTPIKIKQLIQEFQANLDGMKNVDELINYSLYDIVDQAKIGLSLLQDNGFISEEMYMFCWENCKKLSERRINIICHGDLSRKNIMQYHNSLVVIDWEDAMLGTADYDVAYWLTFMEQRRYYGTNCLRMLDIGKEKAKEYMSVIVALKSALSMLNKTYKTHSLSSEERILEIFRM